MAALKSDPSRREAKADDDALAPAPPPPSPHPHPQSSPSPLARIMREFEELAAALETGLLRSLEGAALQPQDIRGEARRLAVAEIGAKYLRKQITRALHDAEALGRRAEEQLHTAHDSAAPASADAEDLRSIHNGYFRLYSTELFDLLGQPTDLRLGTLRFHQHTTDTDTPWISVELALGSSFFVADSMETMPYHAFKVPQTPSLQNRGILSRKPDDNGAFPDFDSWLLFTFLGEGCLKLEVPIEMCADVYGGPLQGRENEDIHFWGVFVDDEAP